MQLRNYFIFLNSMLTTLTLKFKWPVHLVKYIEYNYGNVLQLNEKRYAFRLLVGTKKPNFNNTPPKDEKGNTAVYKLEINEYYIAKTDISYIKNVGSEHFINFIDGQFKEGLVLFVQAQKQVKDNVVEQLKDKKAKVTGLNVHNSILNYCKLFSISEDDVKIETLIKTVQRKLGNGKPNNTNEQ